MPLWHLTMVIATLVHTLQTKLTDSLKVHGAFLAVVDTLLVAKNGRRMLGI